MSEVDLLRILVVDDSAVYRSVVQGCLREIPGVECVGTAKDGRQAVERARELAPDVVLLDVEMPVMSGLQAIPGLRRAAPAAAIVMVSSLTTAGARVTLEALQAGAFDFVAKPQVRAGEDGLAALRAPIEKALEAVRTSRIEDPTVRTVPDPNAEPRKAPRIELVAIGISTGGPSALAEMVRHLPRNLSVPVAVVQHMPAQFTASLADSLDRKTDVRVIEANDGRALVDGELLIAPGGRHLVVDASRAEPFVRLTDDEPVNSFRPSVDVMFRSAAESGVKTLCVVMTGMGADGLKGATAVRQAGGYCLAQDQDSCAVYGMPRAVIDAGQADEIVPLDELAARIVELVGASR